MLSSEDDTQPFLREGQETSRGGTTSGPGTSFDYLTCLRRTLSVPFCIFACCAVASLLCSVFFLAEHDLAYMFSGPLGVGVSIYGWWHMRTIINLKGQVDSFANNNMRMSEEVKELRVEVDRCQKACSHLKDAQQRISMANMQNRENLRQFRSLQNRLDHFNITTKENMEKALVKAVVVHQKWEEEMYKHQRGLLHSLFDRFEKKPTNGRGQHLRRLTNTVEGLSEERYNQFFQQLPEAYKPRFYKLGGFDKLSDGKDYIGYEDFAAALDIFAEMEATDCDIDFEFQSEMEPEIQINLPSIAEHHAKADAQMLSPPEHKPRQSFGAIIADDLISESPNMRRKGFSAGMSSLGTSGDATPVLRQQRNIVITKRVYTTKCTLKSFFQEDGGDQLRAGLSMHFDNVPHSVKTPGMMGLSSPPKEGIWGASLSSESMSPDLPRNVADPTEIHTGICKYAMSSSRTIRDNSGYLNIMDSPNIGNPSMINLFVNSLSTPRQKSLNDEEMTAYLQRIHEDKSMSDVHNK